MDGQPFEFGLIPLALSRFVRTHRLRLISSFGETANLSLACCSRDQWIPTGSVPKLNDANELRLFIDCKNKDEYQQYLRDGLPNLLNDEMLDDTAKTAILAEVVRDVLSHDFGANDASTIVNSSIQFGDHVSQLLSQTTLTGMELSKCSITTTVLSPILRTSRFTQGSSLAVWDSVTKISPKSWWVHVFRDSGFGKRKSIVGSSTSPANSMISNSAKSKRIR